MYAKNIESGNKFRGTLQFLVDFALNLQRLKLNPSFSNEGVTRGYIESLIQLIDDLCNIFFRAPRLFFKFPNVNEEP